MSGIALKHAAVFVIDVATDTAEAMSGQYTCAGGRHIESRITTLCGVAECRNSSAP